MEAADRWQRLKQLFDEALADDGKERSSILGKAASEDPGFRRELATLLEAHDRASRFLETPPLVRPSSRSHRPTEESLGAYDLANVLGAGGTGTVYRAKHRETGQEVAIKIARSGIREGMPHSEASFHRFLFETRVLGRLRHPSIAQVFESGSFERDGEWVPYFVMEFVEEARTLIDYAHTSRLGIEARIVLFEQICDAVHHGHLKGIIHRDLKPGNILVDASGRPKVIDFGIARILDDDLDITHVQTRTGQVLGTLPYLSPEQCGDDPRDVDTRVDVYSLGVVLYELLCGRHPHELQGASLCEAARIIREVEPVSPSTLVPRLRGDLETILLKALTKERTRRYASALALKEDLGRFRRREPIEARPTSMAYSFRKLVERHKLSSALSALVALLMIALVINTLQHAHRLQEERDEAKSAREQALEEAALANTVQGVLASLFAGASPGAASSRPGQFSASNHRDLTVRELMDRDADRVIADLEDQRVAQCRVMHVIGNAYRELGLYEKASPYLERAVDLGHSVCEPDDPLVASCRHDLAVLRQRQGREDEAEKHFLESIAVFRRHPQRDASRLAASLAALGTMLSDQRRVDQAERLIAEGRALCLAMFGREDRRSLQAVLDTARLLHYRSDFDGAQQLFEEHLPIARRVYGEHPDLGVWLAGYGSLLWDIGSTARARQIHEEGLRIHQAAFGEKHHFVAYSLADIGLTYLSEGNSVKGLEFMTRAFEITRDALGEDHVETAYGMVHLATAYSQNGDYPQSEALCRKALEQYSRSSHVMPRKIAWTLETLAMALISRQIRLQEAEGALRRALEIRRGLGGDGPETSMRAGFKLALTLACLKRYEDAEQEVLRAFRGIRDHDSLDLPNPGFNTILVLILDTDAERFHHFPETPELLRAAVRMARKRLDAADPRIHIMSLHLGASLIANDDAEAALPIVEQSLEGLRALLDETDPPVAHAKTVLGCCLSALEEFDRAEALLVAGHRALNDKLGPEDPIVQRATKRLIQFYEQWVEPEEADHYRSLLR